VVITSKSPVAAGGIVSFHTSSIAVRLQDEDRLCDSLSLSIQASFLRPFDLRTPGVTVGSLRSLPCILLSGLSSPRRPLRSYAGRGFGFQGTLLLYHNTNPAIEAGCVIKVKISPSTSGNPKGNQTPERFCCYAVVFISRRLFWLVGFSEQFPDTPENQSKYTLQPERPGEGNSKTYQQPEVRFATTAHNRSYNPCDYVHYG
jgi:hypothetical protein